MMRGMMEIKLAQHLARLLILGLCICCSAQAVKRQGTPPRYEDYAVAKIFKGKPARPLISNPQARAFRTRLREGAAKGPNFAGHYPIVTWGCGTGCQQMAVVDAQTGRVYFPKALSTLTYNLVENIEDAGIKYRLNSRLLVLVGSPGEEAEAANTVGTFYYKWENNDFKLVHAVKKK